LSAFWGIFGFVLALFWLSRLWEAARGLPTVPDLAADDWQKGFEPEPSLCVVVPARNEANAIGSCLQSLLASDYRRL